MPINPDAVGAQGEPRRSPGRRLTRCSTPCRCGAGVSRPDRIRTRIHHRELQRASHSGRCRRMVVVLGCGRRRRRGGAGPMASSARSTRPCSYTASSPSRCTSRLPVAGTATVVSRIAAMYDKGKAAVVVMEGNATDDADGQPLYTTTMSAFIRGEGGWGGDRGPSGPRNVAPDRAARPRRFLLDTADQALLYRLNGDRNPLHSDPRVRRSSAGSTRRSCTVCAPTGSRAGLVARRLRRRPRQVHVYGRPVRLAGAAGPEARRLDLGRQVTKSALFQTRVGDTVVLDSGRMTFA